jgi:hypothetical protein
MSKSMSERKRSPKVGINQLSSMEFRGLASDCVCNHRTPQSSSYASTASYHQSRLHCPPLT